MYPEQERRFHFLKRRERRKKRRTPCGSLRRKTSRTKLQANAAQLRRGKRNSNARNASGARDVAV